MQLRINIDVEDLASAETFYEQALELRVARRLFGGTVTELAGASSTIYLLEKPEGSAAASTAPALRDYRRHWTPVHLDIDVADVDAAVARAVAAGAVLEGAVQSFRWGRQATLSDPFGHGFCFLQFNADEYDSEADEESRLSERP